MTFFLVLIQKIFFPEYFCGMDTFHLTHFHTKVISKDIDLKILHGNQNIQLNLIKHLL